MSAPPIALVGLPATGKSTVGRRLAEHLGWTFHDTDRVIAERTGKSTGDALSAVGEPRFREMESEVVNELLQAAQPSVIACGGGLFAEPVAQQELLDRAWVVCLDADDETLLRRLGDAADRPLVRGDRVANLARCRTQRRAAYARAHLRVDARGDLESVACSLVSLADAARVGTGGAAYPVIVEPGATDWLERHLPAACSQVVIICDRTVSVLGRRLRSRLRQSGYRAHLLSVAGGETAKSWAVAGRLLERAAEAGIGRQDCIVAVGGGSIGDLAGFVAATLARGTAWITVPTTLLAMVDSAIGGKTGVNLAAGKNLAGAFWQPRAVLADPTVLDTLPRRELLSGLGEVAKYAMIDPSEELPAILDGALPRLLAFHVESLALIIERCAGMKAAVVTADSQEQGLRAVLNYGHTVAHALEAVAGYGELTHGEAVAAGMRVAGALSIAHSGCPEGDIAWQNRLLDGIGFSPTPAVGVDSVLQRLGHDKKAVAGQPRWVLLQRRGTVRLGEVVAESVVRRELMEVLSG
ncbi:MAG: 3-dehydroquinate synthase [Candidatus Dormibacteria bacterium]